MRKMYSFLISTAFIMLLGSTTWATDLYVDATRPDNSGNGLSLGTAKKTIQAAIDVAFVGDVVNVASGTYSEQVLVNKGVKILGVGVTKPIVDYLGSVSGKPTLFDVSVDGATIENMNLKVDLSKLKSGIIVSGAGIDNIVVKNNLIEGYGTPSSGTYGDRNAVSINYGGPTNYRVATGGVNSITFENNTVLGTAPTGYFRSGVAVDEGGGSFTGNTLQSINHDVLVRFAGNGAVTISNNTLNGGGIELSDQNASAGIFTVNANAFDGTFAAVSAPGTALLRVKNNYNAIVHNLTSNTFANFSWGVSLENMNAVTLDGNTFTGPTSTSRAVVFNTKSLSSNSNTIVQVAVSATITNNNFNGQGIGLSFLNHDSDNDTYGSFVIGTSGNANKFASTLASFISLDSQTGTSDGSSFPTYTAGGGWTTTMACWDQNLNVINNSFDVGAGLQSPLSMNLGQRTTLEGKLTHKPDVSCLGSLQFFLPVHNLTQNTYFATIQPAITAAAANDVIELSEGTYNEAVTIDKSLTLQGIDTDKSKQVLSGTGLGTTSGIILANGVTGVTIKNLTVQNFTGASGNANAGIYGIGGNNNLTITNVGLLNNPTASGFYANGPISNVSITNSSVVNNGGSARGIVIWNGMKSNITITGNTLTNNTCCGIELQDGNASGVTITGNTIDIGGGDNAIGVTGLNNTVGANTISNNVITGGGRFGIEIKNPAGGVSVTSNTVTLTTQNGDLRDRAGIAVMRRAMSSGNIDVPNGVSITGNTVSGYQQSSTSEGFGIVIEGTNHTVTGNTLLNNEVGILQQQNSSGYPGDADQSNVADQYFGRGNSPHTCGNTISGNTFTGNGTDTRNLGVGAGLVTNTNTVEYFCSIQAAINDADTQNGHTITVASATYNESVNITKSLVLKGAQADICAASPRSGAETIINCVNGIGVNASNVKINGFTIQGQTSTNSAPGFGYAVYMAPTYTGTQLLNNIIKNNVVGSSLANTGASQVMIKCNWYDSNNNPGPASGVGIYTDEYTGGGVVSNVLIDGNKFTGHTGPNSDGGIDISVSNAAQAATGITITNNVFTGNRRAAFLYNTVSSSFTNNVISGSTGTGTGELRIYGGVNNFTVTNNSFSAGSPQGVRITDDGAAATSSNITVSQNSFTGYSGSNVAIANVSGYTGALAATCNWYGVTGPSVVPLVSGSVTFDPFLNNGTDNDLPTVGFQPVPGSCTGCSLGNVTISSSVSVCKGTGTTLTLTGPANVTVTYNLNGSSPTTVGLNAMGMGTIATGNLTNTTNYNLVSVTNGICTTPLTGSATVTVQDPDGGLIIYNNNPFCSNGGIVNITRTAPANGIYSIDGVGLSLNATTGAVNLSASTPGTYLVKYTYTGNCSSGITSAYITITPAPTATIAYANTPYCTSAGTAAVTLTGNTGGVFSSTTGLVIDASTGAINLSSSTAGSYMVTYTIAAANGCAELKVTATVTITSAPVATITYASTPYCSNAGTAMVTLTGNSGGVFSSTSGLVIDASTGAINLATSTVGSYVVTYTIAAANGCAELKTTTNVTITPAPTATIAYSNTPYCASAGTATVTLTGKTGGVFSSTSGLVIDASTGAINLSTSTAGSYVVTYTIAAANGCAELKVTATVTITTAPVATITYASTPYCSNAGTAMVTLTGNSGGVFSSTSGLVIDASTGAINLATSTAGSYVVTYTIAAANGCAELKTTTNVTITPAPTATIAYSNTPYCASAGTAAVTLTGNTGGVFSSTSGLVIDASTGAINLATSTAGSYVVTYTIAAANGCAELKVTATVTITTAPVATITYASTPYCSNAGTAMVTLTGNSGGVFSSTSGLVIDASTGAINLSTSTAGNYVVTYTIAAANGCSELKTTTNVTITTAPTATIAYSNTPYCASAGAAAVTLTGKTGGVFSSTSGLVIDASTGAINLSSSTAGSYVVTYTIAAANGCAELKVTANVTITSAPVATITYASTPYCSNAGTAMVTLTGNSGGVFSSTVGLVIDASTGAINLATSTAGNYVVTYTIAAANGCSELKTTTNVSITTAPTATIAYSNTPYCASVGTVAVTLTGNTGGVFSSTSGLVIDASTGAINLATSTAGSYVVTYTIAAANGCAELKVTATVTVQSTLEAPLILTNQSSSVCMGTEVLLYSNCPQGSTVVWSNNVTATVLSLNASTPSAQTLTVKCQQEGFCDSPASAPYTVTWNSTFSLTLINIGQSKSSIKEANASKSSWSSQFITPDAGPEIEVSTEANPTIYYSENMNKTAPRYWTINVETCGLGTSGSLTFDMLATPEVGVQRSFNTHENNAPYFMYANREGFTELYAQNHPAYGFYEDNGSGGNVYDVGLPKGSYKLGIRYWDLKGWGSIYPATRKPQGNVLAYQEFWFKIQSKDGVGKGAARVASDNGQQTTDNRLFAEVMPNPVSNVLHLKVTEAKNQKVYVSLIDASGRTLLQRGFVPETNQHQEEFEVSELANGMYFLKVSTADKQATLKVVKVQ